jgi:tRNA (guanine10-N2)-dimethyltransferase
MKNPQKDLFFLLHGDHPTLPAGEVKAILEAEEAPHRIKEGFPQILRCSLDEAHIPIILRRAYMTRLCAEELFAVEDAPTEILSALDDALTHRPEIGDGFSLTLHRVKQSAQDIDLKALRYEIIDIIRRRTGAEVDAEKPCTSFIGVFSGGLFLFGRLLAETPQKRLIERRPSSRPFFHPAALQPKLAGCMVNLTRVSQGETLLDPFCGVGSILIEAGLLGCRAVGIDVDPRMVEGSRMNLLHYGVKDFLLRADARRLPMNRVNAVATDPPYGRSATTKGLTPRALLEEFLWSVVELLQPKGYLCAAASSEVGLADLGGEAGLKVVESFLIRVHGSLTRELAVFRRI